MNAYTCCTACGSERDVTVTDAWKGVALCARCLRDAAPAERHAAVTASCDACGEPRESDELTACGRQRVCFDCLPDDADVAWEHSPEVSAPQGVMFPSGQGELSL